MGHSTTSKKVILVMLASMIVILITMCNFSQISLQLYYIPILMMSLWWGLSGWLVGMLFLLVAMLVMHMVFGINVSLYSDMKEIGIMASVSGVFLVILKGLGKFIPESCPGCDDGPKESNQSTSDDDLRARFEALFERAGELIITTDPNGYIMRMNRKAEEFSGYKKEELAGKSILTLAYPEDKTKFIQFWKDLLNGLIARYELRVLAKTGYVAHVLASGSVIRDGQGKIVEIQYNAQDVSENKRAEIRLNEEKEKAQQYLDIAGTMIVAISSDQNVELINRKGLEILGYKKHEIVGRNWFDTVIPDKDRPSLKHLFQKILEGDLELADYHENTVVTRSGQERIIAWHNSLIRDRHGNITGTLSSGLDITEQRILEGELSRNREQYRAIVENSHDGIVLLDEDFHITYANKQTSHITGYPTDEMIGHDFREFLDRSSIEYVVEQYLKRKQGREARSVYEFDLLTKGGDKRRIEVKVSMVKDTNKGVQVIGQLLDITDKKKALDAMRKNEERLDAVLSNVHAGIVIIDASNHEVVDANIHALNLLGLERKDLVGKPCYEFLCPMAGGKCPITDMGKDIDNSEYETITANGDTLFLQKTARLTSIDGQPYIIDSFIDVTGQRKLEKRLVESEKKLRSITSNALDAIIMMDNHGRITFWNSAAERIFGYSKVEILGKDLHEVLAPEQYRDAFRKAFKTYQLHGKGDAIGKTLELSALRKDNVEFPIELSMSSLEIDGDWYAVGIIRDITDRKHTEEKLRQAKDRFETLFKGANEMIITVDSQGYIISANKKVEEVAGYSIDEILGKPITMFSPPKYIKDFIEIRRETLKGVSKNYEIKIKTKKGDLVDVLASASVIRDIDGNVKEMQYNAQDITALKKNENRLKETNHRLEDALRKLKQTQAMLVHEQRMATTGYLAATMAHEINNPLSFIMSNLNTLGRYLDHTLDFLHTLESLKNNLSDPIRRKINEVWNKDMVDLMVKDAHDIIEETMQGTYRIRSIVESLKEFSHVDKPSLTQVSINKLLDSTLDILSRATDGISIEKEYRDIPYVEAYGAELGQAFKCIIENALQAVGKGGKVLVQTMSEDSKVKVVIEDTGMGIKDGDIDRVFDPFYTTKGDPGARGLGLSIAQRIVLMHRGDIDITSVEGKGTRVSITLPMKQEQNQEAKER